MELVSGIASIGPGFSSTDQVVNVKFWGNPEKLLTGHDAKKDVLPDGGTAFE
jgi:hypothetical protein